MIKSKPLFIPIFLLLILTNTSLVQNLGVGLAYATSNSLNLEVFYLHKDNTFKFGGTFQFSDKRGKAVDEQLSNYGQTTDGSGKYFWTFDFGYGKIFKEKFLLSGELSVGRLDHYTNYLDDRFNGGGYHLITKTEEIIGIGLNGGYRFDENWCAFTGFNTIRKLQFGIIWIPH